MEQKRPLRRQPDDHNFGSLDALRHGRRLPAGHMGSHEGLACYASVTGRMEDAKERIRKAIELDRDVRKLALGDEVLRPLWESIGESEPLGPL